LVLSPPIITPDSTSKSSLIRGEDDHDSVLDMVPRIMLIAVAFICCAWSTSTFIYREVKGKM